MFVLGGQAGEGGLWEVSLLNQAPINTSKRELI